MFEILRIVPEIHIDGDRHPVALPYLNVTFPDPLSAEAAKSQGRQNIARPVTTNIHCMYSCQIKTENAQMRSELYIQVIHRVPPGIKKV